MVPRTLKRLVGIAGIALVACSPAAAPAAQPAPGGGGSTPVAENLADSISIGYPVALPSLDPHPVVAQTGAFAFDPIYDQLVRYDLSGKLIPWLATDWKQVDPVTWDFNLRKDVKFSNGEEFDAAAAKWNIERLMNPLTKASEAPTLAPIASMATPDKYVLRIVTKQPDVLLVKRTNLVRMIPPKYFEQVGAGEFGASKAVGSGPYKIKDYQPNASITLEQWPGSWRPQGKMKTVVMRFTADRTAIVAGLKTGDLDAAFGLLPDQVADLRNQNMTVIEGVYPGAWHIELNVIGVPQFKDRRVRQALNYAVDRETIAKTLFRGLVKPAGQLVSPAGDGYDPDLKPYPYDMAKAKALLAEAGYPNGLNLKGKADLTAGGVLMMQAVGGGWKDLGFDVELNLLEFGVFVTQSNNGPMKELWVSRSSDGDVRDAQASYQFSSNVVPGSRAEPRFTWKDDKFNQLYLAVNGETDLTKRKALQKEMVKYFYDEAPMVPVYYADLTWITNAKVKNLDAYPQTDIDITKITKSR